MNETNKIQWFIDQWQCWVEITWPLNMSRQTMSRHAGKIIKSSKKPTHNKISLCLNGVEVRLV